MKSPEIDEKNFKYELPEDEWLASKIEEFEEFLEWCKEKLELGEFELEINHVLLINVFVRIDERKDYFMYFHSEGNPMHMSLEKEIALEAYWLSRYQPVRIKKIEDEIRFTKSFRVTISDVIATMLIVAFLVDKKESLDEYFTEKRINALIYNMFNRDISKEAMIMYVEAFLDEKAERDV